jgi:hypothetical protein
MKKPGTRTPISAPQRQQYKNCRSVMCTISDFDILLQQSYGVLSLLF